MLKFDKKNKFYQILAWRKSKFAFFFFKNVKKSIFSLFKKKVAFLKKPGIYIYCLRYPLYTPPSGGGGGGV